MRRSFLGSSALALGATALSVAFALPASAADEISIDHVASEDGTVSVLLAVDGLPAGAAADPEGITVTVDGEAVDATATPVEAGEIERTTILVLDASRSMRGDRIEAAQAAAKAFLAAAPADVQIGLLTFSDGVQATVAPTTNHETVADAVESIELASQTHVYDAVDQAINLAGTEGARSLLVLSDGADTGSGAGVDDVVTAAKDSGVIIDVVSLDQSPKNEQILAEFSGTSGGKVIEADPEALGKVFTAQADALASQLLVTFDSPEITATDADLEVALDVAGTTYADSAFVSLDGGGDTGPQTVDLGDPLVSKPIMLLGALALGLGLAGVLAVVLGAGAGPSATEQRMTSYFGSGSGHVPSHSAGPGGTAAGLRDSAVAATTKVVQGDFEDRISQRLTGAGSKLTAAEWLLLHAAIVVVSGFVGLVMGGLPLMFLLLLLGLVVPWLALKFRHRRRLSKFNAQLAQTLGLMAGGLQAGLSLPQAVDTVVREGHEPMAGELKRALVEQRLGIDIEDALEAVGGRMESPDFGWVVMAIRIQREVGGNLAEILNTVADTLREREYLRRQVSALSAEGRLSGYILAGLPPLIFFYMMFANPEYVRPLYTTFAGFVLLGMAGVLLAIGGWAMAKMATVEV
jgi:tight adherence protein B